MRKITAISPGIAVGIVATIALSSITRSLLAANDPADQCADRYLALRAGYYFIDDIIFADL